MPSAGDLQVLRQKQAIMRFVVARVRREVVLVLIVCRAVERYSRMFVLVSHRWRVLRSFLLLLQGIHAAKLRVQEALSRGSV